MTKENNPHNYLYHVFAARFLQTKEFIRYVFDYYRSKTLTCLNFANFEFCLCKFKPLKYKFFC